MSSVKKTTCYLSPSWSGVRWRSALSHRSPVLLYGGDLHCHTTDRPGLLALTDRSHALGKARTVVRTHTRCTRLVPPACRTSMHTVVCCSSHESPRVDQVQSPLDLESTSSCMCSHAMHAQGTISGGARISPRIGPHITLKKLFMSANFLNHANV